MNWTLHRYPLRPVTLPAFQFAHGCVVEKAVAGTLRDIIV
jgi:hypothetical protein